MNHMSTKSSPPSRLTRIPILFIAAMAAWLAAALVAQQGGAEAVEIGRHNSDLLPGGKEADGILGDFVLRNDRIHALISGNLPQRRANMMHDRNEVIPGTLFDLDLVGAGNDQITSFRPGHLSGPVNYVRILSDGSGGAAEIETVRTAARDDGLYQRHVYRLEPGWQHVQILSTFHNQSGKARKIQPRPVWKSPPAYERLFQFSQTWEAGAIRVADSIDPFDKRSYAWAPLSGDGLSGLDAEVELGPGEKRTFGIALAVSDSPLAAYGQVASVLKPTGTVTGSAVDQGGNPAVRSSLLFNVDGTDLPLYPNGKGRFSFPMPAGDYSVRFTDLGRPDQEVSLQVSAKKTVNLDLSLPAASAIRFQIRDSSGNPSPAKVQFLGVDGTATPDFGTDYRAHGCDHQYHTHDGAFTQQVPAGNYLIRMTRGPEYDLVERRVTVAPGQTVDVQASLKRTVDTTGWISTDYHSHSSPSGDNHCNTYDRIINFAAEQLEFIPTTEHNRIYDWQPYIDELGLGDLLRTVSGIELTGQGQHFNSFPLEYSPLTQDGGAPAWQYDPRLNAIVLRNIFGGGPDRWVQANHPIVGYVFNDRDRDGRGDGGFVGFDELIDAAEVWSAEILNPNPTYPVRNRRGITQRENRTFGWLQLLNQGRHMWCVAVSDAHRVFGGNGVGNWRTYVPSSTDNPGKIDPSEVIANSKAGRMMITNGPFLYVETGDGMPIGSSVISPGSVTLKVRVQTPNWLEVDRVQVLVNSRQDPRYNYTRKSHPKMFRNGIVNFEETIQVELERDAHLIVVATGENSNLEKGWGRSSESKMNPVAFTNPIYVDTDGHGFQANGDTLDHPLLVAGGR